MEKTDEMKDILGNNNILNWCKRFGVEGIKANEELNATAEKLGIEVNENSIGLFEPTMVKALFSSARAKGNAHTLLSIEQLMESVRGLDKKTLSNAVLRVNEKADSPSVIELRKESGICDLIVIAPRTEDNSDLPPKKKIEKEVKEE